MTMTNEEAIGVLKLARDSFNGGWTMLDIHDALDMAIEALRHDTITETEELKDEIERLKEKINVYDDILSDNYIFIKELIKKIESQERAIRAAENIVSKYNTGGENYYEPGEVSEQIERRK